MPTMQAHSYDTSKFLTIPQAAALSGYSEPHIRMHLVIPGIILATKALVPGTTIMRWLIDRGDFERYMSTHEQSRGTMKLTDAERKVIENMRAKKVSAK